MDSRSYDVTSDLVKNNLVDEIPADRISLEKICKK